MTSTEKTTDELLLDELLKGGSCSEEVLGEHGLLKQLSKRLVERALEAEMAEHLGYEDCFIACADGLKGLPEAIEAVFPIRPRSNYASSIMKCVPWKQHRAVAADLRAIYGAATLLEAEQALERFAERWDEKYPAISPADRLAKAIRILRLSP